MDNGYPVTQPDAPLREHLLQKSGSVSRQGTPESHHLNLLLLPGEIRNSIYRRLLCGNVIRMGRPNIFNTQPRPRSPGADEGPYLDILRVCRTTYADCLSLLYGENTLFYAHYTISNQPFDPFFPRQYLPLVKRIHILVYSYSNWNEEKIDQEQVASMLQQFSVPGVELEYMQIDLVLKGYERYNAQGAPTPASTSRRDQVIGTKSPFALALLGLTTVKKIVIELGGKTNFPRPLFQKLRLGLESNMGAASRVIEVRDNRNIHRGPGPIYTLRG